MHLPLQPEAGPGPEAQQQAALEPGGPLWLHLTTPQALDLAFLLLSLALFGLYHAWYYSWHLWPSSGWASPYHRLDMTGQTARRLFVEVGAASGHHG